MFTRQPRLQLEKFAINGPKRLLQHHLPGPDIALSGWTALKNGDMELTMASGAVFHLGATALTRISWIAAILAIATHRAVNKLQFQISKQETE
jgi:hypothetical protein